MIRESIITDLARGKDVLDVGSAGDTGSHTLWSLLKSAAATITGIDIQESKEREVVCGNMETYEFGRQFDVVVAGDVIEHADNPGLLLDNVRRHLKDNGSLVITTPNAKWWTVLYKPHIQHVLWHDRYTLTALLNRHGFDVRRLVFYPGNNLKASSLERILGARRAMLVVCSKSMSGSNG